MSDEPVFLLGVGAQKCGTSWLYEQLARQPDVMMSPIKELHYWDRKFHPDFFRPRNTAGILDRIVKKTEGDVAQDPEFERVAMDCGDAYYMAYFQRRLRSSHKVIGEISPSYSILTGDEFDHIRRAIPFRVKAVFLMRDPVERLWSQCKMEEKKATNRGRKVDVQQLFRKSLTRPKYHKRSDYKSTIEGLRAAFPEDDLFFGFYETLFSDGETRRLADFLGLDRPSFAYDENPNKSADRTRPPQTEWDRVREGMAEQYDYVRETFGGLTPEPWGH